MPDKYLLFLLVLTMMGGLGWFNYRGVVDISERLLSMLDMLVGAIVALVTGQIMTKKGGK